MAFLAQHWGSDSAASSRKRGKEAARFGVSPVSWWCSATVAAFEDEVVVAEAESLRELGLSGFGRRVAKGFEGG